MKRSGMSVTCEVWGLFQHLVLPTERLLVQKEYVDEGVWHVCDRWGLGLLQHHVLPTELLLVQKEKVDEVVWHVSDM